MKTLNPTPQILNPKPENLPKYIIMLFSKIRQKSFRAEKSLRSSQEARVTRPAQGAFQARQQVV